MDPTSRRPRKEDARRPRREDPEFFGGGCAEVASPRLEQASKPGFQILAEERGNSVSR